MELLYVILGILISLFFTAWFIPQILAVSYRKKLFDYVDARKIHTGVVPRLGGIAFVPSILVSLCLVVGIASLFVNDRNVLEISPLQLSFGLCSIILLYYEGIMDDLVGLRYRIKFVVQIISSVLIVSSGVWMNDFHGLFGLHELSPWIGMPLSVVVSVFIINAINFIDGIDGLASGLSIVATFFFGMLFYYEEMWGCTYLSFVTFGTLLPFFYYNVFGNEQKRRKIFMGDTGSQCIGLILAVLAIYFSMSRPEMETKVKGSIIVSFSLLLVPALDVIRVVIHRFRRHANIFLPDKSHIHHKLLMLGMSHKAAMSSIVLAAMVFVAINLLLLQRININLILVIDVVVWTVAHMLLTKAINKKNESNGAEKY